LAASTGRLLDAIFTNLTDGRQFLGGWGRAFEAIVVALYSEKIKET